jgi:aromatic-L-amino-acid decarboxylase
MTTAGRPFLPERRRVARLLERVGELDLSGPSPELASLVREALDQATVRTGAPRYFGLPHGGPSEAAREGARLAALHDPELATRHHAPVLVALEAHLAALFGARLLGPGAAGFFTSGASEAALTALVSALATRVPGWAERGLAASPAPLVVYASSDAHPSLEKAVRMVGLGSGALRKVSVDEHGRMRPDALADRMGRDARAGLRALAVVATLGTTTQGALDPLPAIAALASRRAAWLHVDAAFGGMLAFAEVRHQLPELTALASATSLAFDPHKAFALPLGAGLFVTQRPEALGVAFGVHARYLPSAEAEPFATTPSWSRPFRAAPLALELAALGLSGLEAHVERKLALGALLRERLGAGGLRLASPTPLPIACVRGDRADPSPAAGLAALVDVARRVASAFVSLARLPSGEPVLRAAITSPETTAADVEALAAALVEAATLAAASRQKP